MAKLPFRREHIGYIITGVGFIADILTLTAFIYSDATLRLPGIHYRLTTSHGVGLSFITVLAYLDLLRRYWEHSREESGYANTFSQFLTYDLVRRKPAFVIPFVLILLFVCELVGWDLIVGVIGVLIVLALFLAFTWFMMGASRGMRLLMNGWLSGRLDVARKLAVEDNWEKWDELITRFLAVEKEIHPFHFKGMHLGDADYALQKYAKLHGDESITYEGHTLRRTSLNEEDQP
jgi:hypothetical protein